MEQTGTGERRTRGLLWVAIAGAVAVRFLWLAGPFIDSWSWRQTDVAAIARNYFTGGFHFAWPQIDWAGDTPGYVGTEFPLLPFLAALAYRLVGVREWIGRSETLLVFLATLPFFYRIVRRVFEARSALWATLFYCFAPLGIVASRAFMPDIPSLGLLLVGLHFFAVWCETRSRRALAWAAVATSVSLLIKLPAAVIGAPLLYLASERFGGRLPRERGLWVFGAVALGPAAIWYWHAREVAEHYYPFHFFGGGGFRIESFGWYARIFWQTVTSTLTPVLAALALAGAWLARAGRGKFARLFHWWLAAMGLFIVIVGWGNRHQWYQLPLVPIAAAFAGYAMARLETRWRTRAGFSFAMSTAVIVALAGCSFFYTRPFYQPTAQSWLDLGVALGRITGPHDLIIAADEGDPTAFYYAQRKGWHFLEDGIYEGVPLDSAQAIANLDKLRARDAAYFAVCKTDLWWLDYYEEFADHLRAVSDEVERTPDFAIYRLHPTRP